ncbi:hypothetical protein [Streptomyces sp. NBC_01358]|uniref:hypothetical protein n=1 Tax=Streptomyces sp. NBC_01358 TaxID=2903837 RepID=UPI002E37D168|nr:hypothetical protein [Streptomyces sp. NBC_01358]
MLRTSRQACRTLARKTGDSALAESRLVPTADGRSRTQRDRDSALADRASTSLIGLVEARGEELRRRQRNAGMSAWELAALLGVRVPRHRPCVSDA